MPAPGKTTASRSVFPSHHYVNRASILTLTQSFSCSNANDSLTNSAGSNLSNTVMLMSVPPAGFFAYASERMIFFFAALGPKSHAYALSPVFRSVYGSPFPAQ
jgi:hypothetical protein